MTLPRRNLTAMLAVTAAAACLPIAGRAARSFRLGITPVFLDNDANLLEKLGRALFEASGFRVEFEQRRTYEEVTGLLLQGSVDVAWLCGYPYLQHQDVLSLLAVPVWQGRPLYQSYLIVGDEDSATRLNDLEGGVHAFSDPDSNSGYLMTTSDLIRNGRQPASFFSRAIFTYGHRNVVRAVASGLVRSGSVDGYVWEVLAAEEPALTQRTKVIGKSEWVGFPPFCARKDRMQEPHILTFQQALFALGSRDSGRKALELLRFDKLMQGEPALFDGIAERMRDLDALR